MRIYYANVDITEGFSELRPGLSAEIMVEIDEKIRTQVGITAGGGDAPEGETADADSDDLPISLDG